jgi:hypothetical protein
MAAIIAYDDGLLWVPPCVMIILDDVVGVRGLAIVVAAYLGCGVRVFARPTKELRCTFADVAHNFTTYDGRRYLKKYGARPIGEGAFAGCDASFISHCLLNAIVKYRC